MPPDTTAESTPPPDVAPITDPVNADAAPPTLSTQPETAITAPPTSTEISNPVDTTSTATLPPPPVLVGPSQSSSAHINHHAHPRGGGRRGDRPISAKTRERIDHNIAVKEERLAQILAYVREHGSITSRDIRSLFGVTLQTANSYTHDLIESGHLTKKVTVSYTLTK